MASVRSALNGHLSRSGESISTNLIRCQEIREVRGKTKRKMAKVNKRNDAINLDPTRTTAYAGAGIWLGYAKSLSSQIYGGDNVGAGGQYFVGEKRPSIVIRGLAWIPLAELGPIC